MFTEIVPSSIKNYTSAKFLSLAYDYVFNSLLANIKNGQVTVEIDDDSYPTYSTKKSGSPLKYGSICSRGDNISANLTITNLYGFLTKVVFGHDTGFGESFVMGDFKVDNLKAIIKIFIFNFDGLSNNKSKTLTFLNDKLQTLTHYLYNMSFDSSRNAIKSHYNISNQFYEIMLGKSMCYTCGLYSNPNDSLYDAQIRKYSSLIKKANISKDDHVLDIGFGWATFLIEAVKRTGCRGTGITISEEQLEYSKKLVKSEGLDHLIDLQLCHYKDLKGKYTKIISIEMMEHVGPENYGKFFSIIDQVLEPNGLFVFQIITARDKDFGVKNSNGFIGKYIFLGSVLPSITMIINAATQHSTLELQDAESIGQHYSITLDQWNQNVLSNQTQINQLGFDQQFINMFQYYLNYSSAGFDTKYINNFQMIFSRPLNTKCLNIKYYK